MRERQKKRVAILISGRGSNMEALIRAARSPGFPAEIVLVLSNKAEAGGLVFAREAGIATAVVEHKAYGKDRAAFDAAMQDVLIAHQVEIVCLAGFMRLLTAGFCTHWLGRMINIHPALLPAFKGLDTHARALEAGVKLHGCTTHFVTPGMDEGPIILQAAVPVLDDDTEASLAARVLEQEHRIYPETLRLLASGALVIEGQRVLRRG
ncbi:MAG: phosphoribosylglycinamide formyltransferase [Beijerinckiaceae bacterium]|nr:phosphoribosylglycinamide formyltransferase [Beijerinckiaceae bacterium]